jgi:hypothetical protein
MPRKKGTYKAKRRTAKPSLEEQLKIKKKKKDGKCFL